RPLGHQVPLYEAELLDGSRSPKRGHGNPVTGETAAIKDQFRTGMARISVSSGRQWFGLGCLSLAKKRGGAFDQSDRFGHLRHAYRTEADTQHEQRSVHRDQNQGARGYPD